MLTPNIIALSAKKLVGLHISLSLSKDRTPELFQRFMPSRRLIKNQINSDIFEVVIYHTPFDKDKFSVDTQFEKWAASEVSHFSEIPAGMEPFELVGGLYAVFVHKGLAEEFRNTFDYIYSEWLPNSEYNLEHRPQFQIIGTKYKNNDPESEEEIWIPIAQKEQ